MMLKVLLCFTTGFLTTCSQTFDNSFHHNVDFTADDSGERFKLHSSGVLSDVINLDATPGIKRLVCIKDRILLVTNQSDVGTNWKVGQLLLASPRWRCNATKDSPGTGVYAKISRIYFPTDRRLSIHVVPAGPFDMIEEANIHFRYTPGRGDLPKDTRTRHRRYLSNILTKILGNIDWNANFSTSIPFNEDKDGVPDRQFTIHKSLGEQALNLTYSELGTDDDFEVRCISCHGRTDMSYVFELIIKKVNNKPKLLKYISQLEAECHLETDMEVEFTREMGVNYSRSLWETGPIELIRIPVAVVRQLPPVELTLSYNTQTLAHVHGYTRRAARARTGFTARGKYTLSQHFDESSTVRGNITSYDWESRGQNEVDMDVKDTLNITADIFQKITVNASITWKQKDIFIDLSPPMDISVRPSIKLETAVKDHKVCLESSLHVQGFFSVAKSELTVEALGKSIWDVILSPQISTRSTLTDSILSQTCLAHCAGPSELGPPLSDVQVCGQMTVKIVRGTWEFGSLQILYGNEILFASEESAATWCGNVGTPCTSCDVFSSSNVTGVCADRYVSARLAPALTKLGQLVQAEWPNTLVVILEAWDEPTSANPGGQHGNSSLHYEGRAAVVTITGDVDEETLTRLGSLSVCSGFEYVRVNHNASVVHVAVSVDGHGNTTKTPDEKMFEDVLRGNAINNNSMSCAKVAPSLKVGDTIPAGQTVTEVCGPPQGDLDRVNRQDLDRLVYYDQGDVVFRQEGGTGDICGHSTRRCRSDCQHNQNMKEPWTWCSTRLMTPRMALKLRQLAKLAKTEGIVVQVVRGFTEASLTSGLDYFREGRGLQLSTMKGTAHTERLALLAACSGFDFTHFVNPSVTEVFVKSHEGFLATRVEFPDEEATTLAVDPSPHQYDEYQYPLQLREEVASPHLVSGFHPDTFLSEHYKVKDILCPNRPYFRVDSSLLLCLDLVTDEYSQKVEILPGSGYRTQSVNMINFDIRHPEEKFRFQTGQAVELRPPGYRRDSDLVTLAKTIFRSCTPFLREEMRGVGIGCHQDRLYLDIRPVEMGKEMEYITVWQNGDSHYCGEVQEVQQELLKGGPVVNPFDKTVCSFHPLGQKKTYLTFQFQQNGICSTSDQPAFCSTTLPFRQRESKKLQELMTSAAGYGRLPRADIHRELDKCLVTLCGGCPGTGRVWDEKVIACSVVVDRFITRATRAFPDLTDRAAFYNTETVESTVHSLACHDGNICVENIQLYSLFMLLVTSRYLPDPKGSIERMMFSSEMNPTPLLELVEQEMAYRAKGVVKVFVEHQTDLKDIRTVVKVLMVYNQNVTEVQFHVSDDLDIDLVTADLQRSLDVWAGSTCPEHGRFAIAPYTFHELSHTRRKRSLERSEHRNEARRKVYHWELDWMMKLL